MPYTSIDEPTTTAPSSGGYKPIGSTEPTGYNPIEAEPKIAPKSTPAFGGAISSDVQDAVKNVADKIGGFASKVVTAIPNAIAKGIDTPDQSKLGTSPISNALKLLPSSFAESLPGIGSLFQDVHQQEGQAPIQQPDGTFKSGVNLPTPSIKDVAKTAIPAAGQVLLSPVADVAGIATGPKTFNVPFVGPVKNAQQTAVDSINAGVNPYEAVINAVPQAIFDGLMVAGIAEKTFSPRIETIGKGVSGAPGLTESSISGDQTFRQTQPSQPTVHSIPNEALTALQDQGVKLKGYNPENPSYFKVTPQKGGILKGEIIQIKPSYFNTFIKNLKGDIDKVPPSEVISVYDESKTPEQLKDSLDKNSPVIKAVSDIADKFKNKEPINISPEIKTQVKSIAKDFKPALTPTEQNVTIARHGETLLDEQGKAGSVDNSKLTDGGIKEAEKLATKLKGVQVVITSGLPRSKQTGDIISKSTGAQVISSPKLNTWNIGKLVGKPEGEVDKILEDYARNKPNEKLPNGESFNEFKTRVEQGIKEVLPKTQGKEATIITHGDVGRLINSNYGKNLDAFFSKGIEHGQTQDVTLDTQGNAIDNKEYGTTDVRNIQGDGTSFRKGSKGERDVIGGGVERVFQRRVESPSLTGKLSEIFQRRGEESEFSARHASEIISGKPFKVDKNTPEVLQAIGFSQSLIDNVMKIPEGVFNGISITPFYKTDEGGTISEYVSLFDGNKKVLVLNPDKLDHPSYQDGSIIPHEISGHAWWNMLSDSDKLKFYDNLKNERGLIKEAWQKSQGINPHTYYWQETLNQIHNQIKIVTSSDKADAMMIEFDLQPDANMSLDNFIDRSLNLDRTIGAINAELYRLGKSEIKLKAENTSAISEHVAMIAENSSNLPSDDINLVGRYISDVQQGTLSYGDQGVNKLTYPEEVRDLSTSILEKLGGRDTVSKQFIQDLTNSADVKQVEKELIRDVLKTEGPQVDVYDFRNKVREQLLPLTVISSEGGEPRYENVTLPDNIRGDIENYFEHVYESPIKTSAGAIHFADPDDGTENYFGHTRLEDLPDGDTRRIIEVQSDLYQKGRLENERISPSQELIDMEKAHAEGKVSTTDFRKAEEDFYGKRNEELAKLQQYNDPTAHFRMVREEIKKAAEDGKTKLQFPTGETAMKIEGLGQEETNRFIIEDPKSESIRRKLEIPDLKIGQEIKEEGELSGGWIITDVLRDGKFKAIQKKDLPSGYGVNGEFSDKQILEQMIPENQKETFDISGKVDISNPIYRFYEKDLGRYLKNKYNAKPVTDDNGVTWMQVDIIPKMAQEPVLAFRQQSTDLDQLYRMLDRTEQSIAEYKKNPEMFVKAYGPDRINERNAQRINLMERIEQAEMDKKLPKDIQFSLGDKLADVRATLAAAEARTGVKPIKGESTPEPAKLTTKDIEKIAVQKAPMIRIATKDIKLPDDLTERQFAYEMQKEFLNDSPLRLLKKYEATVGEFKGELPEVGRSERKYKTIKSGQQREILPHHGNKLANDFSLYGDDIVGSDEFLQFAGSDGRVDTEDIRELYSKWKNQKEENRKEGISIRDSIRKYTNKIRDDVAIDRISRANDKELEKEMIKKEEIQQRAREADDLANWKSFVAKYAEEASLPQSLSEVTPPKVRGGLQSPELNFAKWKDVKLPLKLTRDTLERNLEKVATPQDAEKLIKFFVEPIRNNETDRQEYLEKEVYKPIEETFKKNKLPKSNSVAQLIQLYGDGEITIDDLKITSPKNWEGISEVATLLRDKIYPKLFDFLNQQRVTFGYEPIKKLQTFRLTHMQQIDWWTQNVGFLFRNDDMAATLPTELAGRTEFFKPGKPFTKTELHRLLKKREGLSAVSGIKAYAGSVTKQAFHIDSIQRGRALEKYLEKSAEVGARLGTPIDLPTFKIYLTDYIQEQLGAKVEKIDRAITDKIVTRKMLNAASGVASWIGRNIIRWNPGVALTHFGVGIPLNLTTVSKPAFAKGLIKTMISPLVKEPYYMLDGQRSDYLYRRYPYGDKFLRTGFEKVGSAGDFFLNVADRLKTKLGVSSKYYEEIAKGTPKNEAMKIADKYAARLFGDYSFGQKPTIFGGKVVQQMNQFQFGLNDAFSVLLHDIPENAKEKYRDENGNWKEESKRKVVTEIISRWLMYSIYAALVYEALKDIKGVGKGFNPLHLIGDVAGITSDTSGQSFGKRLGTTAKEAAGEIPFTSMFLGSYPTATLISQLGKDITGGDLKKLLTDAAIDLASPIGGGLQISKTLAGIQAIKKGESVGTGQNIKSILFGASQAVTPNSVVSTKLNTKLKTAQTKLDGFDSSVVDEVKPIFDQAKAAGFGTPEADDIVSNLTDDQYKIYTAMKSVDKAQDAITLEPKVLPIVQQANILGFGSDQADKLINDSFPDTPEGNKEYDAYVSIKNSLYGSNVTGTVTPKSTNGVQKSLTNENFITRIGQYAKAVGTDPVTAFKDIFSGEVIRQTENGQIIVERNSQKEAGEKKALGGSTAVTLDHIKSLEVGGNNSTKNMWLIPVDQAAQDDKMENLLGNALRSGKITGTKAQELELRYKKGTDAPYIDARIKSVFDKVGDPLTFDEVKQIIDK